MTRRWMAPLLFTALVSMACGGNPPQHVAGSAKIKIYDPRTKETAMVDKVMKTEEEWKKELTPEEYRIARQAGTERAFANAYWDNHEKGMYYCKCCGTALFASDTKFDSGTGWPSFFDAVSKDNVRLVSDHSLMMERIEVRCARCDAHLGHLFDDGPRPTGQRYCMNSASMQFKKQ